MNIVVSGSRGIKDCAHVERAIGQSGWQITYIRHGGAGGVDQCAALTATKINIPFLPVPAQWNNMHLRKVVQKIRYDGHEYNAAAGHVRNEDMIKQVGTDGGLIAVWDGDSPGTANCIAHAILNDVPVFIYKITREINDSITTESYHVKPSQYLKDFSKDIITLGYKKATIKWRGNRYSRH